MEGEKEIPVSDFELLPKPICQEIFFRINAIDIMHCKRVCKSWYKILREPNFAMTYSEKSPFSTIIFREIVAKVHEVWYLVEFSEKGDFIRTQFKPTVPDSLKKGSRFFASSSCNGLLCISVRKPGLDIVSISNPVLGECVTLPQHEIDDEDVGTTRYMLGFVPSINKYKVVRIVFEFLREDMIEKCEIFTIGVDEGWRHVENGFTGYHNGEIMPCLNGVLYWIPKDDSSCGISTFDLEEEKTDPILNAPGMVINWRTTLRLFRNQLYLLDKSDGYQITVWTMQKYGIAESWTKDVVLGSWFPSGVYCLSFGIDLVGKSRNGDMFFLTSGDRGRTFYRVKDGKCSEIGVLGAKMVPGSIMLYEPSFLSVEEFMV